MSGHSKWATTKHQKAVVDARRSNLFTKLANVILVAARSGGDAEMNYSLRLAIEKAKAANMPHANIERAIKRGTGELGGAQLENITYEIYGPSGSAILAEVLTDNKNRTSAEVKSVLNKFGGKIAGSGSVSYHFDRRGIIAAKSNLSADEAELLIIDSGADDYEKTENGYLISTGSKNLKDICENLKSNNFEILSQELALEPKETINLDEDDSAKVIKLLEALDELDDVTEVNSNLG
ncbi:MAG: YebC/PmpR family DNA-binding transcriptional regulator [Candidatus Berkelbacteria bacterium]|nr:YebC/PmpR family DNA-binding transcriptional regulator [Candidatus Berkelbacteria bacterium]